MKTNKLYYLGLALVASLLFVLHSAFAFSLIPIFLAVDYFKDLFVLQNGAKPNDICYQYGLKPYQISRIKKKYETR
jgi:hypothetical protein